MDQAVAIIGTGVIGSGWAVAFLSAGISVKLFDLDHGRATIASDQVIDKTLELASGAFSREELQNKVQVANSLQDALDGVVYAQESVAENQEIKQNLFSELDKIAAPEIILASSSSALLPSDFLNDLPGAGRCLVAHPFNPPYLMPLVEIVPSKSTSQTIVQTCKKMFDDLGFSPIVIEKEVRGYVANRLQAAVINEAMNLVNQNVISPQDLDKCLSEGLGLRWAFVGPFETMALNAENGFTEYATKFGKSYQQLGADLNVACEWQEDTISRIENSLSHLESKADIKKRCEWRDSAIVNLLESKHKLASKEG